MIIKNSVKILVSNVRAIFSDLLFRLILFIVCACAASTFVIPFLKEVISSEATGKLFDALRGVVGAFFDGGSDMASSGENLSESAHAFLGMLTSKMNEIRGVAVGIAVVLIVYTLFFGTANYASGVVIGEYMSSLSGGGYISAILAKPLKCFLYQLIEGVVFLVFEGILIAGSFALFVVTAQYLYIFAPMIALFVFWMGNVIFCVFFSNFLPAVTSGGKSIAAGLKESFSLGARNFVRLAVQYVLVCLALMYLNVTFAVFTFGVGNVIVLPASCVFMTCVRSVEYFRAQKRKYYVGYGDIVTPPGADEDGFFDGDED